MEITDELITQWEPKIQRFLKTSFVLGMDREDLGQELRISIVKAAEGFDESRGISFHTYLHTTMINTLRTLISKARKHHLIYEASSLDESYNYDFSSDDSTGGNTPSKIIRALEDPLTKNKEQEFEAYSGASKFGPDSEATANCYFKGEVPSTIEEFIKDLRPINELDADIGLHLRGYAKGGNAACYLMDDNKEWLINPTWKDKFNI